MNTALQHMASPITGLLMSGDRLELQAHLAYAALSDGYPERRARTATGGLPPRDRIPATATIVVASETETATTVVAHGTGWAAMLCTEGSTTDICVAAIDAATADALFRDLGGHARKELGSEEVGTRVWQNNSAVGSWHRVIDCPQWSVSRHDYPPALAGQLDQLHALDTIPGSARLIVWTGPPGTGKTSAVRALIRGWREWCQAHLITDPEQFFGDATYLLRVMTGLSNQRKSLHAKAGPAWNLVICEDADDFLHADTRMRSGSGVGRLLNLADGILGQGLRTVVLLTTNAPLAELDPALLRPGRCLARMQFPHFTRDEARAWLGEADAAIPDAGVSLAGLYHRAGDLQRYGDAALATRPTGGMYL